MYLRRRLLLCLFFLCFVLPCHSGDIITSSGVSGRGSVKDGETIVSAGKRFELGFFSPQDTNRYVGIWYYGRKPQTLVWVANRDNPLSDSSGSIAIKDGNFTVLSGNGDSCFSVGRPSKSKTRTAQLLDSGNLVLSDDESGEILWQSFDFPTDTFLPGMKMAPGGLKLISWKSTYTFQQDEGTGQYIISSGKSAEPYWKSGDPLASLVVDEVSFLLSNFSKTFITKKSNHHNHINYSSLSSFNGTTQYKDTRLVMNSSGEIQFYIWDNNETTWNMPWHEPQNNCSVYNFCGSFGTCNNNHELPCKCLPGYEPKYPKEWKDGKYSNGCSSKSSTSCNKTDIFLNLTSMKIDYPYPSPNSNMTEEDCIAHCLGDCECRAYSFGGSQRNLEDYGCRIWTELNDLQEDYHHGLGLDLSVRVAISDIGAISRSCKPCGINVIPYPLSSQPECGDPMYHSFYCDENSGELSFTTSNSSYPVLSINLEDRSFMIENDDSCDARNVAVEVKTPFHAESWCSPLGSPRLNINKIEIRWKPPLEPICDTSIDCYDWPNSSCNNVTEQGQTKCLCKPDYKWDGSTLNCTSVLGAQGPSRKRKGSPAASKSLAIYILAVVAFLLSCSLGCIVYKRKLSRKRREIILGMPNIGMQEQDLITEDDKKNIEVPFFRLGTILEATDNFSNANKLGQGGFGPVYKGNFPGGQTIAVKRLLSNCGQGVDEFKNEVMLIAKLQHRNLVKLLGYCITTNEKILLYEYMPNKSLDFIIFDRQLSVLLDWKMRFDIILGIARGLLYLHQDSRLRIIHRDLKVSNILLDEDMNPKISDFGLARIVEGKSIEANTNKVVGTFGYMSPEYALEGLFSIKSDVFSFGVVLLEIISGRKNTSFFQSQESPNLLSHTWKLWMEEMAVEMVDPSLLKSSNRSEILKCIHISLLCVQEDPSDRPTMSDVVIMLVTESMSLHRPNQPAFVSRKRISSISSSSSSSSKPISHSNINNELTVTMLEGR